MKRLLYKVAHYFNWHHTRVRTLKSSKLHPVPPIRRLYCNGCSAEIRPTPVNMDEEQERIQNNKIVSKLMGIHITLYFRLKLQKGIDAYNIDINTIKDPNLRLQVELALALQDIYKLHKE